MSFGSKIPANTNQVKNLLSTGVVSGCVPTVNAGDNTKLDISSGIIRFVDNATDPTLPNFKGDKVFPGATALSTIPTEVSTRFIILEDLTVITEPFGLDTNTQTRDRVLITIVIHFGANPIQIVAPALSNLGIDKSLQLADFMRAVGHIRLTGLLLEPNGANLSFNITAGTEFSQFYPGRTSAPKDPTTDVLALKQPATFFHSWRDGLGGWAAGANTDFIDVGFYDDGTPGATPNGIVNNNQAAIWRVYEVNTSVGVLYPQQVYVSINAAVDALPTEIFEQSVFFNGVSLRGFIVARGGALDFTDPADALFFAANTNFVETRG